MGQEKKRSNEGAAHWCEQEFQGVALGDRRLNHRLISLAQQLSEQPLDPINQACENQSDVKAAYRFFANETTQAQAILRPHVEQTIRRMQGQPLVLAVQDTSFINYTTHLKTQGLGKIGCYRGGANHGKGLVMHTTLALNAEGVPLGILDQQIWARARIPTIQGHKKKLAALHKTPIEKKESFKWLQAIRQSVESIRALSGQSKTSPQVISIADREADLFEFMEEARNLETHFVVRAHLNQDRVLIPEAGPVRTRKGAALHTLLKHLPEQSIQGYLEIEVPRKAGNTVSADTPARIARAEVRFCSVRLALPRRSSIRHRKGGKRPGHQESHLNDLSRAMDTYAVWIREVHPPKKAEPLEWLLLTDLPVLNMKDAEEKIHWYRLRWRIESFHKILKSGCRVEQCRLETAERLQKYLTLFSVIAWRILWMTLLNREKPDHPCTEALTEVEWKALYCRIHQVKTPPQTPPSVHQAIRWIARLGGFLGRKCDKEPGMITIWRGWQRLNDIADTWELLHAA